MAHRARPPRRARHLARRPRRHHGPRRIHRGDRRRHPRPGRLRPRRRPDHGQRTPAIRPGRSVGQRLPGDPDRRPSAPRDRPRPPDLGRGPPSPDRPDRPARRTERQGRGSQPPRLPQGTGEPAGGDADVRGRRGCLRGHATASATSGAGYRGRTASPRHHEALRELDVIPVDYRDGDVSSRVRELAPAGVDAVFDHVGGRSVIDSWHLLAPGGTLVAYGSASTRDDTGSKQWPVMKILARAWLWNTLPNGRHAHFYNIWAGRALNKNRFRACLRADLTEVFAAVRRGDVTARIAAQLPLAKAAAALRLAESGTVSGKVVLTP
ncbi:hypothetical protein CG719_20165 [Streptomyces sp. CB01373]|nr:hypothetical protein CG719_20165 [Streptomyces sp. CB01373]